MRRSSRLLLVFWLHTLVGILVFVIVAIILDFDHVGFFRFVATLSWGVSCVNFDGWSGIFLAPFSVLPAFFLLFPSFLGGLNILNVFNCHFFSSKLGFFNSTVFYEATQTTAFSCSGVGGPRISRTVLIHLSSDGAKPEWRFTLSFHDFLYQQIKTL